jgi:hypothetical protein
VLAIFGLGIRDARVCRRGIQRNPRIEVQRAAGAILYDAAEHAAHRLADRTRRPGAPPKRNRRHRSAARFEIERPRYADVPESQSRRGRQHPKPACRRVGADPSRPLEGSRTEHGPGVADAASVRKRAASAVEERRGERVYVVRRDDAGRKDRGDPAHQQRRRLADGRRVQDSCGFGAGGAVELSIRGDRIRLSDVTP